MALTVILALAGSLLLAVTVTPLLAYWFVRARPDRMIRV